MAGHFNGSATLSSMSFAINSNSVFKLINSGNTKGDALLQVLSNILGTSNNRTLIFNRGIFRGSNIGRGVTFISSFPCFGPNTALGSVTFCFGGAFSS